MSNSFIIIGMNTWECASVTDIGRLTKSLSRNCRVLYVEPPCDIDRQRSADNESTAAKGRQAHSVRPMIRQISERLILFSPPVVMWRATHFPRGIVRDTVVRINSLRFAESIGWAARTVGIQPYTLVSDNAAAISPALLGVLNAEASLYYLSCSPLNVPIVRVCDAVISTSSKLCEAARGYNLNSFDIGEGVNPRNGRRLRTNWNKSSLRISAILSMLRAEEKMFDAGREKDNLYN